MNDCLVVLWISKLFGETANQYDTANKFCLFRLCFAGQNIECIVALFVFLMISIDFNPFNNLFLILSCRIPLDTIYR